MKRQRAISVLDGRCERRKAQNLLNDSSSLLDIAFARNCLMKDCCRDVVVHRHIGGSNQAIASNAIEDRIPLVSSAHQKDSSHLLLARNPKGRVRRVEFLIATNAPLFGRHLSRGRPGIDMVVTGSLRHVRVRIMNCLTANDSAGVYE